MTDTGTVRNMEGFNLKNTLEKSVHLVPFITRIYHDARPPERQIPTDVSLFLKKYRPAL